MGVHPNRHNANVVLLTLSIFIENGRKYSASSHHIYHNSDATYHCDVAKFIGAGHGIVIQPTRCRYPSRMCVVSKHYELVLLSLITEEVEALLYICDVYSVSCCCDVCYKVWYGLQYNKDIYKIWQRFCVPEPHKQWPGLVYMTCISIQYGEWMSCLRRIHTYFW